MTTKFGTRWSWIIQRGNSTWWTKSQR